MSFRTDLLAAVDAARALSGPAFADIRTNFLTIRTRVWSGTYIKEGTATDTDLVLPARYPIRFMSGQEIDGSGGSYEVDDILVNHITPTNGAGVGYTPAQLNPQVTNDKTEIIYLVTGTHGGEYSLVDCRTYRPFTYQLVLRRRRTTP